MKTAAWNETNCWKIQEKLLENQKRKQTFKEQTYEWIGLEENT